MSTSAPSSYAVLLPAAQVAVFSVHEETRAAVAALAQDWRFARVRFDIQTGDVASAIHTYTGGSSSPNLLIVDTDVIDSSFTALLEQLASSCSEGTDAVVVGPVNDIALYRFLINLGVGDYLVRPLQTSVIADVIARILLQQLGASESNLVTVVGAKGGVGTSTVAGLLGYGLAETRHEKTILMDMAGGRSYLSVSFGQEPVSTMNEAARAALAQDQGVLNRLLVKAGDHLQILATGTDRFLDDGITGEQMERILDRLLSATPYVLADLSASSVLAHRALLARAQHVVVVSLPTLASLRMTRSLLGEIKDMKGGNLDHVHLVVNMAGVAPGSELNRRDIESALEHKVSAVLPFDPKVIMNAEAQARILGSTKGAEKFVAELLSLFPVTAKSSSIQSTKGSAKSSGKLLENFFRKGG